MDIGAKVNWLSNNNYMAIRTHSSFMFTVDKKTD